MTLPSRFPGWLAAIAAASLCWSGARAAAEKPPAPDDLAAIFPGTSSKEPISIDADKLVYYDKEHKAVYSGNVVVIQGDTKMTCSAMTVFLDHAPTQGAAAAPSKEAAAQPANGQSGPTADAGVRHLDAAGPVTVVSKTQVATGDSGSYDKAEGKVRLIGHVTLSDGQNVTKGRQADLRPQERSGDRRHQRQVGASARTIRSEIGRRRHKAGRCENQIGARRWLSFARRLK